MKYPTPIHITDLLLPLDQALIQLLESLSENDWLKPTTAPLWNVKDVAVHLLDGNIRTLSMLRDEYYGDTPGNIQSYQDLVAYLNRLNADWVKAMKRISPKVLIELLENSGKQYCDFLKSLDPFAPAKFPVGWAGESESQNWFHIAREYTEKWHHQQQIRVAIGQEDYLLTKNWYLPYLETSMRALPHHFRTLNGETEDLVKINVFGNGEKYWFLQWETKEWKLVQKSDIVPTCTINIPDTIAWRVFTKGISVQTAIQQSELIGKTYLGQHFFKMIAIMG